VTTEIRPRAPCHLRLSGCRVWAAHACSSGGRWGTPVGGNGERGRGSALAMKVTRSRGTAGRCGSGNKHTGTTFTAPPQRCRHPSWRRRPTGSHGQWSSERDVVLAVSFSLDDGRTPVSELVHDQSADSATTGAPTSRRRAPRSTRVVLLLSMLAAASMVTAGCTPTTASTSSGSTTGSGDPRRGQ
jgi:hypothetical protein